MNEPILGYAVVRRADRTPVTKLYTRLGNAKNARTQLVGYNYNVPSGATRKADQQRRASESYAIVALTSAGDVA